MLIADLVQAVSRPINAGDPLDVTSPLPAHTAFHAGNIPEIMTDVFPRPVPPVKYLVDDNDHYMQSRNTGRPLREIEGRPIPNVIGSTEGQANSWFLEYLIKLGCTGEDVLDRIVPGQMTLAEYQKKVTGNIGKEYRKRLESFDTQQMRKWYLGKMIQKALDKFRPSGPYGIPPNYIARNGCPNYALGIFYKDLDLSDQQIKHVRHR